MLTVKRTEFVKTLRRDANILKTAYVNFDKQRSFNECEWCSAGYR